MLGIKALAVITPYPEMGFDVDKVGHVQVAERILKNNRRKYKWIVITIR